MSNYGLPFLLRLDFNFDGKALMPEIEGQRLKIPDLNLTVSQNILYFAV